MHSRSQWAAMAAAAALLLCLADSTAPAAAAAAAPAPAPAPAPAAAAAAANGLCQSGQPPQRVALPFCSQYACSCCTPRHALALAKAAQPVQEDEDLSASCKRRWLGAMCRVCDPQVGTGAKRTICRPTCEALYNSCKEDFFAFEPASGAVAPCTAQVEGQLVCSQLADLASSADEFCRAAGLGAMPAAGDEAPCFDGAPVGAEACPEAAAAAAAGSQPAGKQQQQRKSSRASSKRSKHQASPGLQAWLQQRLPRLKRRHRRQLAAVADLGMGTLLAAGMAWLVVLMLRRVMQPSARRLRNPGGAAPTNAREVLARAAEARRRAGLVNSASRKNE